MENSEKWLKEQKREDVIEEIVYNSQKTSLTDLKRIGWTNGFPDRFRSPSWQLLLHYLPGSRSKRKSTLRRKRIEYHRHITKHYFEFDFCLTDRKLPSAPPTKSTTPLPSSSSNISKMTPSSKRRLSITSHLQQSESERLFEASLMPLFSQPSSPPPPNKLSDTREDSLLLQIRQDVNQMVKIPTSSSSSKPRNKSRQKYPRKNHHAKEKEYKGFSMKQNSQHKKNPKNGNNNKNQTNDIHEESTTTTNRLFANPSVKSSLERILYLWSIRIKSDKKKNNGHRRGSLKAMFSNASPTTRYIPGMVDLVYPLYLTILHGYIWDTHISTTLDNEEEEERNNNNDVDGIDPILSGLRENGIHNNGTSFLMKLGMKEGDDEEHDDDDYDAEENEGITPLNSDREKYSQSDVLDDEIRESKIKLCEDLRIGKGIDDIPEEIMDEIEADTFWCLEYMMNAIQDYRYNDAFFPRSSKSSKGKFQSRKDDGIQKMIVLTEKVIQRVDPALHSHLKSKGVEFQWFCFRWMNTLHVRTMNEKCMIRLWDTCLCEEIDIRNKGGFGLDYFTAFGYNRKRSKKRLHLSGFLSFQIYVCAALMHLKRDSIVLEKTFDKILYRLQNLSLDNWGIDDVTMLLSQAFVWKETFSSSEDQLFASARSDYGDDTLSTWVKNCHWPPRKESSRPSDSLEAITNILNTVDGKVLSL